MKTYEVEFTRENGQRLNPRFHPSSSESMVPGVGDEVRFTSNDGQHTPWFVVASKLHQYSIGTGTNEHQHVKIVLREKPK